jgi:3',5'-cyclic AMP phosphodiesterase CpdA
MQADAKPAGTEDGDFPFLRRRGGVAIIGVNSAVPTPVFQAWGDIGTAQMQKLAHLLEETGREGLFRVVLIHHPPTMGHGGERKALRDRAAFCAVLAQSGAELVLSGHHHVTRLDGLPGPAGPIPSFGVPAALASQARPEWAAWHLHRIETAEKSWQLTTLLRRYNSAHNLFEPAGEWRFALARQECSAMVM